MLIHTHWVKTTYPFDNLNRFEEKIPEWLFFLYMMVPKMGYLAQKPCFLAFFSTFCREDTLGTPIFKQMAIPECRIVSPIPISERKNIQTHLYLHSDSK